VAKKAKTDDAAAAPKDDRHVRLSTHPRAKRHIAMAKGWGGLAGFALVLILSLRAGAPAFDAGWHALLAGIGFSTLGWAAAVSVWRQVAVAEVRAAQRRLQAMADAARAEAATAADARPA